MEIDYEALLKRIDRRAAAARNAGGISKEEALDNIHTVPDGWVFDHYVNYWLPPNVVLFDAAV